MKFKSIHFVFLFTLVFYVVLLFSHSAYAATPAFVQNVATATILQTDNKIVITTGKAVAQGDTLVVVGLRYINAVSDTIASVTDSKGNTYHIDVAGFGTPNNYRMGVASAYINSALTAQDTVTITWTNASGFGYFSGQLTEYSGLAFSNWTDQTSLATAYATQANGITSGATGATSQADELIFGALYVESGTETITAGSGFNMRSQYQYGAPNFVTGVEDKTVSATGAQTCTGSWGSGNQQEMGICVTYKAWGGGAPDTTAPVISSVSSSAVTSSSATITWNTDENSDTQVEYGLTTGYGQSTTLNSSLVASHSVNLSGLSASTLYHYRVKSKDSSNNLATSPAQAFTTTATPPIDTTAPTVPTNLSALAVSSSAINLFWTASTDAVGVTGYKIFRNGVQIATSATNSYSDSGLSASTQYTYTVSAYDTANNNSSQSTSASATTQSGSVGSGANIYISQSGSGNQDASSCANAKPVSFFNTYGNWAASATVGKISPGTTVHLCGTFTGNAGSTMMTFQGSGISGSPITLLFESGAKISSAYWGVIGALNTNGKSYLVIDGGTNGVIESTANGDGFANKQIATGIYAQGSTNWEAKNLTIQNIYVHTQNSSSDPAGSVESYGFLTDGTSFESIHNNTISQAKYGIFRSAANAGSGNSWYSNVISKTNWAMGVTAAGVTLSGLKIYGNEFVMGNEWDDTTGSNHHNGIYAFTDVPETGQIIGLEIYNNYFHGSPGQVWTSTADIFTSYGVPSPKIYNNLFIGVQGDPANAYIAPLYQIKASAPLIYNNTIVGSRSTTYSTSNGNVTPRCIMLDTNSATSAIIKNNICSTVEQGILTTAGSTFTSDYNDFYNLTYYGIVNSTYYSVWSGMGSWQAGGRDVNSINLNPALNFNYTIPPGSPVIGAGVNLISLGIFALNSDKAGIARPATGSWDIGAYEYTGSTGSPPPATPLSGDLNLDHIINSLDFSLLNSKWNQNYSAYDLNGDGFINSLDFAVLKSNWGKTW